MSESRTTKSCFIFSLPEIICQIYILCLFSSQPYLPTADPDLPSLTGKTLNLDVVATVSGAFLIVIYDLLSPALVLGVLCLCAYDSGP